MSYLLDKKLQKKRFVNIILGIILLFTFLYFNNFIFNGLSFIVHGIFRPVFVVKNNIGEAFFDLSTAFKFKKNLFQENEILKNNLAESNAKMLNYDSILDENTKIKEILNRKNENTKMLLSAILSKPNKSVYDTLIIDIGSNSGIKEGDLVFALGAVPIGYIGFVYPSSSKVVLFSNSGEKIEVALSGVFMEIIGRGGGNFEMIMPRDFNVSKGNTVVLPGIFPYVVAIVETIISDPRDSFAKALLTSPVNIGELKFVQVKINN